MSKSQKPKPQIRQQAEEAVAKLVEEHDEEVLGVIRQLLAERVPKPRGRRVDALWPVYLEMARILRSGKTPHVIEAARRVAHLVEGVAESTAIETLRKAYPKYLADLEAELDAEEAAAEAEAGESAADLKDSIIERAFDEDIEAWDL